MKILAHRGLPGPGAPENTRAAFARAIAAGAEGLETDVRLSADGVLVLAHDRLLPDGRPVADLSAAVLGGAGVEPLEPALAAWPAALWNLEVKDRRALPGLARLLAARPGLHVLVSSFDHEALATAPLPGHVRRGALLAHRPAPAWPGALPPAAPAPDGVHAVVLEFERVDARLVQQARRAGLDVWAWGPESDADHRVLARLALDAVITDHPARALCARATP